MKQHTIGVHQPNFLPWLGYFSKIKRSDVFVFLDNVQYTKNSYINRVQIVVQGKAHWLTVPVVKPGITTSISEVVLANPTHAIKKILKTISLNYCKAPYFDTTYPSIEKVLSRGHENLSLLNQELILAISHLLELECEFHVASSIPDDSNNATERLINICNQFDASIYLSGKGGFSYQDMSMFEDNGISIEPVGFAIAEYPQNHKSDFIGGLSIIDALFNIGPEETAGLL